ncbi:IPT/TIG domain-containing protein [Reichenbachiella agariperforans]|uniref:IPT/TIG domain-containing protein n=1 Tax=Reichenbachiella agariperforans TaxID=156994 RepID=A0A1M6M0T9_REIAG|nr:IPT/TIG domain-containing protein [Reichenbachiella agariperforans]SHJ77107.1 IPT/TIG domain-containing protein [Reichenbachiella agariperforans]
MKKIIKNNIAVLALVFGIMAIYSACEPEEVGYKEYPEPTLGDFSPKAGKPNALVTITGTDFGDYADAVTVTFGDFEAEVIESVANEEIKVRVPSQVLAGENDLMVTVWTHDVAFSEVFNVLPGGVIDSIAPVSGVVGDIVTIYGKNFGTVESDVQVFFSGIDEPVQAKVLSVSDTKIEVEVPLAVSGPLTVQVDPQELQTERFTFPFVGVDAQFDSDNAGWVAQQNATQSVADGELSVEFVGGSQADLMFDGNTVIDVGTFPILAVRMSRLGDADLQIISDIGVFGNDYNTHSYVGGAADVVYWDLSAIPLVAEDGSESMLDALTVFREFGFHIDARSSEMGYSVDWIKSYESIALMKADIVENYPAGKLFWEFDTETLPAPDWTEEDYLNLEFVDHRNNPMWQEDGKFWATHTANRLGFWRAWDGTRLIVNGGYPAGVATPVAVPDIAYNPEYPIIALKGEFWGATPGYFWHNSQGNNPGVNLEGATQQLVGYTGEGQIWYIDGATTVEVAADYDTNNVNGTVWFDQWGFDYNSGAAAVEGTNYWVDWVISFKSVEELEAYAENH